MKTTFTNFSFTKRQFFWTSAVVIALAGLLRFYQLGQVPHGMTWDEAAIGYNGFAIFNTRRDEWLTRLPVSFWSFGDYKAPLAIYLNGFFTAMGGMTLWAVRLPFALAGLASVVGMIYLVRLLADQNGEKSGRARFLAVVAGFLLAFSPWHHHFSRIGFESGLALMFFIWAIYFFYRALTVLPAWRRLVDFTLSSLAFTASIYTYHSAKITVPLVLFLLVIFHAPLIKKYWRSASAAALLAVLALVPLVKDALYGNGLERAGTLVLAQTDSAWQAAKLTLINFGSHLSNKFLLLGETTTLRHGDGVWGVLLPTTAILVFLGLWFLLRRQEGKLIALGKLGLGLMLLGILPAALGSEVPHSNRALLALPGFILLAVFALQKILTSNLSQLIGQSLLGTLLLIHGLLFITYLNHYYTRFAKQSAADFQDGYLAAFRFVVPYERGESGLTAVDKIIFTSAYGQPYIYALFVRETNPIWYQGGSLVKYEFKDRITVGDLEQPNTLVVASQTDDLLGRNFDPDKIIYGSDGEARFRIYLNQ
ncbi:MAG TPA: glycosyltransferase family 39 protein [Patescibacteria group bacterium]